MTSLSVGSVQIDHTVFQKIPFKNDFELLSLVQEVS